MEAACSRPLFLCADDSALMVTGEKMSLGKELQKCKSWLCDKLSLYLGKSECTEALIKGHIKASRRM